MFRLCDDIDLAMSDADGVHVGQDDLELGDEIRKLMQIK